MQKHLSERCMAKVTVSTAVSDQFKADVPFDVCTAWKQKQTAASTLQFSVADSIACNQHPTVGCGLGSTQWVPAYSSNNERVRPGGKGRIWQGSLRYFPLNRQGENTVATAAAR